MTVTLTGGTGLFDRLGTIGHVINILDDFLANSSADDLPKEIQDVVTKYDGASNALREAVEGLIPKLATFQGNAVSSIYAALRTAAENTLIEMVHADNPLSDKTVANALDELIRQMDGANTVNASAAAVTVAADAGNSGDGPCIVSVLNNKGKNSENAYAEDIIVKVTANATEGDETIVGSGEDSVPSDLLDPRWPEGSDATVSLTVADPGSDGFVNNGTFESFTTNAPNNWTIDTGAAGADILEESTIKYRGTKCLEYLGDGATLTQISQSLSSLLPRTPYPVSVWVRTSSTPGAGNLIIDLYDGSSVINDDEGNANSLSIDLTSVGTSFANQTAVFRLPDPLPATVTLRVRLSTALSNTVSAYIDDLIVGPAMTKVYTGGPYLSVIRGASRFGIDDFWTAAVTNTKGSFQQLFHRLFNLPEKLLPSNNAGGETISDSLIA